MKIHELKIEGFKSIGEIKLVDPNPFSVFVGPNGAGKSNIFEALELISLHSLMDPDVTIRLFGTFDEIFNQINESNPIFIYIDLGDKKTNLSISRTNDKKIEGSNVKEFRNFSRIFIREPKDKVKRNLQDDLSLASDADNLEKVLKRILKDEKNRVEIIEILQLLIPGFSNVEIRTEELSGSDNLVVYEDALKKPMTKRLISDGTYNILALITAIYQSETPQFLCIEEPENGLNPKVVKQLVSLFRDKCKEKGHYIWLNTHSQTLVSELTPDEIILVYKVNGLTQTKQVKGFDLHGMKMDEALLTNALGGGIPW